MPRTEYANEYLDKYYKFDDGDGRLYWKADITGAGVRKSDSGQPWKGRDPTALGRHWALPEQVMVELVGKNAANEMSAQEKLNRLDGASHLLAKG
jgi:hypothetical protein